MDLLAICAQALISWGPEAQVRQAIEEMAELTKELCKSMRGRDNKEHVAEEIADVEIVLAQMKLLYDCFDAVERHKEAKLRRLEARLEEEQLS